MNIYPFIYTKVPPGASPWGKQGFHTVFYPITLLGRTDIARLETHIHVPEGLDFEHKQAVFFQRLAGEDHLVIIDTRTLPEARDQHGRKGNVLGQGFLFQPALWQAASEPLTLLTLIEGALFPNPDAVLDSPRIDRATGNIAAITVTQEQLAALPKTLPPLRGDFELRLAILLNRWARSPFPLLINGEATAVGAVLNRLAAYVPNALKPRLGWDSTLDGGNLIHFPLRIAGFSQQAPQGGNPFKVCLTDQTLDERQEFAAYTLPHTPYEWWLERCPAEAVTTERREQAYRLASFLDEGVATTAADLQGLKCFAAANTDLIVQRMMKRCGSRLGELLARCPSSKSPELTALVLLIEDFPLQRLAPLVEDVVLQHELTQRDIEPNLLTLLAEADSAVLHLLQRVWRKAALQREDLAHLPPEIQARLVRYLAATGNARPWLTALLQEDEALCEACFSSPRSAAAVHAMVVDALMSNKDLRAVTPLLDRLLAREHLDFRTMARIVAQARRQPCPAHCPPYVQAFLYPEAGIPPEVMNDTSLHSCLLDCLVEQHGFGVERLTELGFSAETVEQYEQAATIHTAARRLQVKAKRLLRSVWRRW